MNVAVVAEGVTDYIALEQIFKAVAAQKSVQVSRFDAIQPKVDATSSTQLGGGGWTRVEAWLKRNSAEKCREIFQPQLFSASVKYDLLIVHLDGDVVGLSRSFSALDKASCFGKPDRTAALVEAFIERLLQPPDDLDDQILYAVPVMQTEAWLIASQAQLPFRVPVEARKTKEAGQRYLAMRLRLPIKDAIRSAGITVGRDLAVLRRTIVSLEHFGSKLEACL